MRTPDALTVCVCVFFGAGALSLFAEPLTKRINRRRRARKALLAEPVKVPVTRANRAMRARRANVVWNLPPTVIADKLGPYDAEFADLQHWVDELATNDDADAAT